MELTAPKSADYEFLDAGNGGRLERFGPYVFERPSPVALWEKERPQLWKDAAGVYRRHSSGGGEWVFPRAMPATWPVKWRGLTLLAKPTGFGHMGIFPECASHWEWVEEQIRRAPGGCSALNLFAYTGGTTIVAARAGAEVCHVDAVRDVNDWARRNAEESGVSGKPIRWITDDAMKFLAREIRRGRTYDAIVFDPPSYGKGPKGERWILEEQMTQLLDLLLKTTSRTPRFVLFTCHTLGFSPPLMKNLLLPWIRQYGGKTEAGTMVLTNPHCRCVLPAGFFARWSA